MDNNNFSNGNNEKIFDIIQSIQEKLNNSPESNNVSNFDSIFTNNFNEKNDNVNKNVGNNEFNLSGFDSITSILSNLNINAHTIMKFQRAFSALNQNDPRKNLLYSLKPFLRDTRKQNIDTYITLLGVINAIGAFSDM